MVIGHICTKRRRRDMIIENRIVTYSKPRRGEILITNVIFIPMIYGFKIEYTINLCPPLKTQR